MVIRLSSRLSALWQQGGWLAREVEETLLEDIERMQMTAPVGVQDDSGGIVFWIKPGEGVL